MTDNEIIKALECCLDVSPSTCKSCPLFNITNSTMVCSKIATKFALDLINRQKAEVENLKDILYDADGVNLVNYWYQQCKIAENGCRNFEEENKNLKAEVERLEDLNKCYYTSCQQIAKSNHEIKAEAVKEFANMILSPFRNQKYLSKRDLEIIVENLAKYC